MFNLKLKDRHRKALSLLILFLGVLLVTLLIGVSPFYLNEWFLTSPDSGGLACGAEALASTGVFSDGRTAGLGYNFNVCWTQETSPNLQVLHSYLLKIFAIESWKLVIITSIIAYLLCVLGIMIIGYRLIGVPWVAAVAGLLAASSPPLLRSLILTPQNVFGYLGMLVIVLAVVEISKRKSWASALPWWIAIVFSFAALIFSHRLSFGVASIVFTIWIVLFYPRRWVTRFILILLGLIGSLLVFKFKLFPIPPQQAWQLFQGHFTGYDHPLYDHPALWGYIPTLLAAIGLLFPMRLSRKTYGIVLTSLIIPIILAHLSWFGLSLLPDRFVAFSWIGIVLFAAVGSVALFQHLHARWSWFLPLLILVIGAQVVHGVVYSKDDVSGWSARFRPHQEFREALLWLNEQPEKGTLVGIMAAARREITFAPFWYDGTVASYPWYNLNHRNIKSFKAKSALYEDIFADPTNPEYLRVKAFYSIITHPNSDEAKNAVNTYRLQYLIVRKNSPADEIWQQAPPPHFPQIYENDKYHIYKLR